MANDEPPQHLHRRLARRWRRLLPGPLRGWVGVGVDGRWVRKGGRSRAGIGRVRGGGITRHHVMLDVSGRGGGGGGGQVEVEGGRRGGGRGRGRDPLQNHVRVELRLGAVEAGHGRLQKTLLAPGGAAEKASVKYTFNGLFIVPRPHLSLFNNIIIKQ